MGLNHSKIAKPIYTDVVIYGCDLQSYLCAHAVAKAGLKCVVINISSRSSTDQPDKQINVTGTIGDVDMWMDRITYSAGDTQLLALLNDYDVGITVASTSESSHNLTRLFLNNGELFHPTFSTETVDDRSSEDGADKEKDELLVTAMCSYLFGTDIVQNRVSMRYACAQLKTGLLHQKILLANGGVTRLCLNMRKKLATNPNVVFLDNHGIIKINQTERCVQVTARPTSVAGPLQPVMAHAAVLAGSVTDWVDIEYTPSLPVVQSRCFRDTLIGAKAIIVIEFQGIVWPILDNCLTFSMNLDNLIFSVESCRFFSESSSDKTLGGHVLVLTLIGIRALNFVHGTRSADERRRIIIGELRSLLCGAATDSSNSNSNNDDYDYDGVKTTCDSTKDDQKTGSVAASASVVFSRRDITAIIKEEAILSYREDFSQCSASGGPVEFGPLVCSFLQDPTEDPSLSVSIGLESKAPAGDKNKRDKEHSMGENIKRLEAWCFRCQRLLLKRVTKLNRKFCFMWGVWLDFLYLAA